MKFSGLASIEWCACNSSYRLRGVERRVARQKAVEGAAQAVDVGPDVGLLSIHRLLGSDVMRGAQHLALLGQAAVDASLTGHLGQAEVEHLDHRLVPIASEHQVARLDVDSNPLTTEALTLV
jgi:hypothetical protein